MSHGTLKSAICSYMNVCLSYMNVCLSLEPKTKSSILLRKEVTGASAVPRLVEEVVCQGNEKDSFLMQLLKVFGSNSFQYKV